MTALTIHPQLHILPLGSEYSYIPGPSSSEYDSSSKKQKSRHSSGSYTDYETGGNVYATPTTTPTSGVSEGYGNGGSSVNSASAPSNTGSINPVSINRTTSSNSTVSSGSITPPAGCVSRNGISIGWLPDSDAGVPLSTIIKALPNQTPCFAGYYAQIHGSSWDGSQLTSKIKEVTSLGQPYPIFVASVMPSIPMSGVPSAASSITFVMKELTSAGLTVWLRFAHEMNWYDTPEANYVYPKSSVADYQKAWSAVSAAVAANPDVNMFWSPNSASASSLKSAGWYPTGGAVDVIGIDIYPDAKKSFSDVYENFCKGWDVPFSIGETGKGPSEEDKKYWYEQLSSAQAEEACPNYVGFSYFEYDKKADFRVATAGHTVSQEVLGSS